MSGGSWDYFYHRLDEIADRVKSDACPVRRAFGDHLAKCATALREIEWVDSGDTSPGDEFAAIRDVLGDRVPDKANEEIRKEIIRFRDGLNSLLNV